MSNRCEDYPCCGHTDGLPCDWTYTPEAQAADMAHSYCEHWAGYCEVADREEHKYDMDDTEDDVPWCYGCDGYAKCGDYDTRDGAAREQWEVTTPPEVYMSEDSWLDGSYEE